MKLWDIANWEGSVIELLEELTHNQCFEIIEEVEEEHQNEELVKALKFFYAQKTFDLFVFACIKDYFLFQINDNEYNEITDNLYRLLKDANNVRCSLKYYGKDLPKEIQKNKEFIDSRTVDYNKIYDYITSYNGKVITASQLAFGIGVDRVYGATMTKLVREGLITPAAEKGYYYINK